MKMGKEGGRTKSSHPQTPPKQGSLLGHVSLTQTRCDGQLQGVWRKAGEWTGVSAMHNLLIASTSQQQGQLCVAAQPVVFLQMNCM